MVQSPESSEYDGMPRSAIATGLVDYILPPAEMPAQLIAYVTQTFGKKPHFAPKAESTMKKIFNLVKHQDWARLFQLQAEHNHPPHRAAYGHYKCQ